MSPKHFEVRTCRSFAHFRAEVPTVCQMAELRTSSLGGRRPAVPVGAAGCHAVPAVVPAATTASYQPKALPQPISVRPVPGPGQHMTGKLLSERWASSRRTRVIDFYGHSSSMGDLACFSNFYDQRSCPFDFVLPLELDGIGLAPAKRTTRCAFSEKAIMLCKAAVFGDSDSYSAICKAHSPAAAKALGRSVQGFNDNLYSAVVCSIAFEVVYQKFSKTPVLQPLLLATGEKVIAEATRNDRYWGIGIDRGDPRCQNPSEWRGTNILGWALMEVRSTLSRENANIRDPEQALGIPGTAPCGSASFKPVSLPHPASTLNQHEKNFLKHCKVVRDIWKLEDQKLRGERLEAMQEQKLNKKAAALKDARDALEYLAGDSALRLNNKDVVTVAIDAGDAGKEGRVASERVVHDAGTPGRLEPEAPIRVMPIAVEDQEGDADEKPGARWRKRGGRSHFRRVYDADHPVL